MIEKQTTPDNGGSTILRRPAVQARTGLCRSTIYQLMSEGTFPKSIAISARSRGWLESEIDSWITQRIEISRKSIAEKSR